MAIDHGLSFPTAGTEAWGEAYLLDILAHYGRSALDARQLALLQRLLAGEERIVRELLDRGLRNEEIDAMLARIKWLIAEGRLPKAAELLDGTMYGS